MFKKGEHKTFDGSTAIVAQIKSVQGNFWLLRGAIEDSTNKVLVPHIWNVYGQSQSGNPDFNLVEKIK